jgi:addiction module HigA family antidote
MSEPKLPPIHPGEILLEEFLKPMKIEPEELARDTNLSPIVIQEVVAGRRSISPETALRLSRYFSVSERFWMNLQARYDLEMEKDQLGDRLEREVRVYERPVSGVGNPL